MDKKLQERLKALSPEKRELLLKKLREQKKGESSEDTHINLLPRDTNVFPLSFAQERLWFFTQLEPESPLYNLPVAIKFTGELKVDILQKVFERLVERHEILRTTFEVRGKKQVQVIQEPYTWDMPVENFDHLSSDEQHKVIINKVSEEVLKLFDLGSLPLMRTRLLSFSEKEHVLILVSHHIVSDGWSFSVMINEMNNLYNALCNNTEVNISSLDIHYADYSVWQKETLQGEKVEELISFWRKQLEDVPVLSLPVDNPRPPIQTYNGKRYNFNIEKDITENIKTFSKDHGVTLFMTLFSIYAILIQKYSRQKDFAIGSPIANRNNAQVEPLIGFFVNMLALRCDLEGDPTFIELLNKIKKTTLDAYSHQDLPFEKLVDELVTTRDMSRSPLFQVAFVLQTAHSETFNFEGLTAEKIPVGNDASGFDMTMEFYEIDDALHGAVEYNADLFDEVTIKAFATYYNRLIDMVCDRPEERISAYSLLSPEEYALITQQWNETDRLFPSKTVVELFEEQVVKNPTQTAVIWQDESLTYDELNRRANKLAHFLQKQGAAPGTLVGLCVERSIELFVGLIGIIKSGAAYVPMDPEYPEDRLEYMIADEDVKALLTEESLKEKILNKSVPTFLLDKEWGTIDAEVDKNCASAITPDDLIYVIYTSGSTGKPKGVEVFHKSVVNICSWHQALCKIDESTKMTQMAGIGFDATGLEYWPYLTGGAILFPVPKDTILNPPELMKFYTEHGITHSFAATPIAEKIFLEPVPEKCTLTYLLTGGEKLNGRPPVHVPYTVIDHYGPAEATITTTFCVVPSEGENVTATVGRPLDNMKVFILDESLAPVPIVVPL